MPLKARLDGRSVYAFDFSNEAWIALKRGYRRQSLAMACCDRPGYPSHKKTTKFFAHKPQPSAKLCQYESESEPHLRLKAEVAQAMRRIGWDVETEAAGISPNGEKWKADVLCRRGDDTVAVEIQISEQPEAKLLERISVYESSGLGSVWLLKKLAVNLRDSDWLARSPTLELPPAVLQGPSAGDACAQGTDSIADFLAAFSAGRLLHAPGKLAVPVRLAPILGCCLSCNAPVLLVTHMIERWDEVVPGQRAHVSAVAARVNCPGVGDAIAACAKRLDCPSPRQGGALAEALFCQDCAETNRLPQPAARFPAHWCDEKPIRRVFREDGIRDGTIDIPHGDAPAPIRALFDRQVRSDWLILPRDVAARRPRANPDSERKWLEFAGDKERVWRNSARRAITRWQGERLAAEKREETRRKLIADGLVAFRELEALARKGPLLLTEWEYGFLGRLDRGLKRSGLPTAKQARVVLDILRAQTREPGEGRAAVYWKTPGLAAPKSFYDAGPPASPELPEEKAIPDPCED